MATYDFSRLRDIEEIAGSRIDEVIRGTLLDMTRKVIFRTPVGNPSLWQDPPPPGYVGGTARGNWQATIGNPAQGELNRTDQNGQSTVADAAPMTEAAPGNVYYLTNNVPYIERLESGAWSSQAPQGMVRVTLSELGRDIDAQIAELRGTS